MILRCSLLPVGKCSHSVEQAVRVGKVFAACTGTGRRSDRRSPAGGSQAYPPGTQRLPLTWLMDSASAHVVLPPSEYHVA